MSENTVSMKVFTYVIGIIFMVIGFLFSCQAALSNKVDVIAADNSDIKTQLSQIQTDLKWIINQYQK